MKEQNKSPKKWISIRVKSEEYSVIYNFFLDTTCRQLSEYVRLVLLQKPVTVNYRNASAAEIMSSLYQLKNELSYIGNNFNQSVKVLHQLREVPEITTWAMLNESAKKMLFIKVEEIRLSMLKIEELCSR